MGESNFFYVYEHKEMITNTPSRDELKKKLREKIRGKRSSSAPAVSTMRQDPQTAMLSMGVDDLFLLQHSNDIIKNPHKVLESVKSHMRTTNVAPTNESDDEESPPQ